MALKMNKREQAAFIAQRIQQANQTWAIGDRCKAYRGPAISEVVDIRGDILVLANGDEMHRSHGRRPEGE